MAENTNIKLTVEAWAKIVIERWEQKIEMLKIGHSGKLADSFYQNVITQADGNPEKIEFAFEYYGKFVDMGVGRGVPLGKVESENNYRKRKPWYSPIFFGQVKELAKILAEKYAYHAQLGIVTNVERFNKTGQQISESHTKIDRSDKNRKLSAREYDKLHGN
jgi:hypothetical protein